jgi:hypothetical protein
MTDSDRGDLDIMMNEKKIKWNSNYPNGGGNNYPTGW